MMVAICLALAEGQRPSPADIQFMRGLPKWPAPRARERLALCLPPDLVDAVMEAWEDEG